MNLRRNLGIAVTALSLFAVIGGWSFSRWSARASSLSLAVPAFAPVNISGTTGNDTLIVNATGTDSASLTLNGVSQGVFSGITSLTFDGLAGNDTLQIVNPAGGLFALSGGITCNGGAQSSAPGDRLLISGGAVGAASYTFTGRFAAGHNGTIVLANGAVTANYTFTGLEPIEMTGGTVTDVVFNLPNGADAALLRDDGTTGNGISQLHSDNDTFETTSFTHPSSSLRINAGSGDVVTLALADDLGAANLTVDNPATIHVDNVVTTGTVMLATSGTIAELGFDFEADITASKLGMAAGTGVGGGVLLRTQVSNLEATTNTGGIRIFNGFAGPIDLVIGGVSSSLPGLRVETSGTISIQNDKGSITLADTDGGEIVRGGSESGSVLLQTEGANSDITATVNNDAVTTPRGSTLLDASRDILLGLAGRDFDNDVRGDGRITLSAGRDTILSGSTDIVADAFGNDTGEDVSISGDRNVELVGTTGSLAAVIAAGNAGSEAKFFTGDDGKLIITIPNQEAVISQSGNIVIRADRMELGSQTGLKTSLSGEVTIQPVRSERHVDLGPATDVAFNTLELSDAELDRVFSPTLRIGSPGNNATGNVAVTSAITAGAYSTLELRGGAELSGPASVSVPNLILTHNDANERNYLVNSTTFAHDVAALLSYFASSITVNGSTGNNSFFITPTAAATINIDGRAPVPFADSGDFLTVSLPGTINPGLTVSNTATGLQGSFTFGNRQPVNFSQIEILPQASPDLAIVKTGPATASAGTAINYSIVATNNGELTVAGATITDNFPVALTNASWTCAATPGSACAASGAGDINQSVTLAPRGTVTFSVTATVAATAAGSLRNTATIAPPANVSDPNAGNNSSTTMANLACPAFSFTPTSLPNATLGAAYNQTISTTPSGAYTVTTGALPIGLMLNSSTGVITGTPAALGTFSFTITSTVGACTGSQNYSITVGCSTITVMPEALPAGQAGITYSQTITAAPAGPYTFSLAQGSLPSGLTLNPATGVLSGMASTTGTFSFVIKADLGNGCSGTRSYLLAINCPTITLAPATLPNGLIGAAYNQTLSAQPVGGNYSFAIVSGALPAGLSLNPATGIISGTPTVNGLASFTIRATGFGGCAGNQSYSINIGNGSCPTIMLPASLPNGAVGQLYSNSVVAAPAGSYSYEVTAGSLPQGLTLFAPIGLLNGFPTAAGVFNFTVTASTTGNCTGQQAYTVTITNGSAALRTFGDFDGDGKSDLTVWRGQHSEWLIAESGSGQTQRLLWGAESAPYHDSIVPGDYDGDGKFDVAVFRRGGELSGHWLIKQSSDGALADKHWGLGTDIPVPGDYDGDGKTDVAVWRGSEGTWYVQRSSDGRVSGVRWGAASAGDVPVSGDFDGDGKTDLAVFRRGFQQGLGGYWFIKRSSDGQTISQLWGLGADVPVPGDYDGDGQTDIAVWRGADTHWYILKSADGATQSVSWGAAAMGDVPAPADYDGDGKTDVAVWRAGDGHWYVQHSSDGATMVKAHGRAGDTPAQAKLKP